MKQSFLIIMALLVYGSAYAKNFDVECPPINGTVRQGQTLVDKNNLPWKVSLTGGHGELMINTEVNPYLEAIVVHMGQHTGLSCAGRDVKLPDVMYHLTIVLEFTSCNAKNGQKKYFDCNK